MRELALNTTPNLQRHYRSETHWYIPHYSGQLKMTLTTCCPMVTKYVPNATYYKGTSTKTVVTITNEEEFTAALAEAKTLYYEPNEIKVQWVLPNGQVIEGMSIDAEVEEGTTLCICSDFYACGLTIECGIALIDYRDMPPFQGYYLLHSIMPRHLADFPKRNGVMGAKRNFISGAGLGLRGTSTLPNPTIGTTKDIRDRITAPWLRAIEIMYCPYITGDLSEIKFPSNFKVHYSIWGDSTTRDYVPHYEKPESMEVTREGGSDRYHVVFHHCGVHGVPNLDKINQIIDWEYYACPNASPEDFDGLIEELLTKWAYAVWGGTVDGIGFTWINSGLSANQLTSASDLARSGYSYEAGQPIIPCYGTLKISNRTADPVKRAERISLLRTAGWTVEEIDDSLEDGIYAVV